MISNRNFLIRQIIQQLPNSCVCVVMGDGGGKKDRSGDM
jgi:hypothetical protein